MTLSDPVRLHPQAGDFIDTLKESDTEPLYEMDPPTARAAFAPMIDLIGAGPGVWDVRDLALARVDGSSFGARLYRPTPQSSGLCVYFHGGGWVLGNLDWVDAMCRRLANISGLAILSVDYRLAPEHVFPAGVDDAFTALQWAGTMDLGRAGPLIVAGDSAGGNLAAVCARRARDASAPKLDLQVLVYPVTDHDFETPSYREHGASGLPLGRREMEWFWDHYVADEHRGHPDLSPLRAESLAGVAPAIVLVAGFDPLYDEGVAYADRLRADGALLELIRVDDMHHGFFTMVNVFDRADEATDAIGMRIRERFGIRSVDSASVGPPGHATAPDATSNDRRRS